ncbi:hypothetical protein OIV83_005436 [Microbotryomycetes sp. JL201]|nr:hypothetical protein OIV83_005436 [Microbotryomycetes sp. JL201]
MLRAAARSLVPRLATVAPRAPVARSFASSVRVLSEHSEPVIQGPGGKAGEVPTDYEQATGLERFELLMKLKGEEAFSLEPLQVERMGTVASPIEVFSLDHERIVGCTGFPVDSHDTVLFPVNDQKPVRWTAPFGSRSVQTQAAPAGQQQQKHVPEVHTNDKTLTVRMPTGEETTFHYLWLRDHCREPRSFHPATKQRLVDTYLLPRNLRPSNVMSSSSGLTVSWPNVPGSGESYDSFFPWSFLLEQSYAPALPGEISKDDRVLWTSAIRDSLPVVAYDEVMTTERGVYEWLNRIHVFGFSLVSGIPPTPEATEQLIRRIAFIRETHYGGFWDFTADLKHGDLAYSDVLLQAHTDTTYFTDSCGLQMFHLLSPSSSHKGGHNLLVDGFRAARQLKEQRPDVYKLLSTLPVPAHASGTGTDSIPSGVYMRPLAGMPVLNHDEHGKLVQVRWNGDDRGVVGRGSQWSDKMDEWYDALHVWETILRSDESALWQQMQMGTAVIFDNHRVLHGRSSFTGLRRLCGAYVNHDDYRSRYIGLKKQFGPQDERDDERRQRLRKRFGLSQGEKLTGTWAEFS